MRKLTVCFLLFCAATQSLAVRISSPHNGIAHPRRERCEESTDPRRDDHSWEPNDTRRPLTGKSGWQYNPGNKWKAPRDAKAEKRREYERIRRQNGASRLRVE